MLKDTYILGIETSCDETSVAIVKNGREVLSNIINSQIKIHEQYGGVVPEIASRCHIEAISTITKKALEEAHMQLKDIDAVACTYRTRIGWRITSRSFICKSIKLCNRKTFNCSKSYSRAYCSKLYYTF